MRITRSVAIAMTVSAMGALWGQNPGSSQDLDDDKGKAKKDTDAPEMLTEARSASRAAKKVAIKVKGVKP